MRNINSQDPLLGLSANHGLHVLKDKWIQKSYMGAQCGHLADNLGLAIQSTITPHRIEGFRLDRGPRDPANREHRWEQSVWKAWSSLNATRVQGCWYRIVAYQVPLKDGKSRGWGHIDLLGISQDGLPVIIELKKDPKSRTRQRTEASETPLRIILEAAAYGVALRRNWDLFRPEFVSHLQCIGIDAKIIRKVPQQLPTVRLVAAAPAGFWIDWLPVTPKGLAVSQETWKEFQRFLVKLQEERLLPAFVSIAGDIDNHESLAAQPLTGFPPRWTNDLV